MSVDYKELEKLALKLGKTSEKELDMMTRKLLANLAERLKGRVVRLTPVDTGNLRKNWSVSRKVEKVGNTYSKELYNNTEYAPYVEYGHRTVGGKGWVNGRFMLKKARDNFDKSVDSIVEKELDKFYKKIFDT
jgi:HK97 gp10 family phage protein